MQLQSEERAVLAEVAWRCGVAVQTLIAAVEAESAPELAAVLGIGEAEAEARLEPLRRAAMIGDDWGAGCKLLTDEVRAEIRAALRALLPATDYSASSGVSQG